jgi:outer membrane protein TolC
MVLFITIPTIRDFLPSAFAEGKGPIPQQGPSGERRIPTPWPLSACIDTALENNPDLRSAREETKVAAAESRIAEGERWPSLRVKGGASRHLDEQRLLSARFNGEPGVFDRTISDIGVTLRMPLFTGGRIVNTIRAAELTEAAVLERFVRTREELVFNVTSAFFTILGRRREMESITFSRNILEKDRDRIDAMISAGKAARSDRLRIDVRLARVEQSRVRVRNEIEVAWRVLYNLMGLQTAFDRKTPDLEDELLPMPPPPDPRSAFEFALKQRSDLQAAIALAEAFIRKAGDQEVEIKVRGTEVKPIFEFAQKAAARLQETSGLGNVTISMDISKPEYRIFVDRAKASALGIGVGEAA